LRISFEEPIGHEVVIFEHVDGHLWCYDPALDDGYGNFGGSYQLGSDSRDPLYLAFETGRGYGTVKGGKFMQSN
jgi:hypothetical protein